VQPGGNAGDEQGASGIGGEAGSETGGQGGASPTQHCDFDLTVTRSLVIPTVVVVEWSVNHAVDAAEVEFGLDAGYGMKAPVDLSAPDHKTFLLGMKPDTLYHYRMNTRAGAEHCSGSDQTIHTGELTLDLPQPTTTTVAPSALAPGFLISEFYGERIAFILDQDGDYVWAFAWPLAPLGPINGINRARLSSDGKSMWIASTNRPATTGEMLKVSMDGTVVEDLSSAFGDLQQDFVILADGTIYYLAWDETSPGNSCTVKRYDANGETHLVAELTPIVGNSTNCAAIQYSEEDDTLVVSDVPNGVFVKLTRSGDVTWKLGGPSSDFTGSASTFAAPFSFQTLSSDRLLVLTHGQAEPSRAFEVELDLNHLLANKGWEYVTASQGDELFGDVQRLANGNTQVAYSHGSVLDEVNADGELLRRWDWGPSETTGYFIQRATLYGPSPK
jgi:hypothetical protein